MTPFANLPTRRWRPTRLQCWTAGAVAALIVERVIWRLL